MNLSSNILEVTPLVVTFAPAILSSFNDVGKKWQNFVIGLLGGLFVFFFTLFLIYSVDVTHPGTSMIQMGLDKFSLFVGFIFCGSLFVGMYPIRKELDLSPHFLYYIAGGLGIILSNNIFTFFIFWTFQRALPFFGFIKNVRDGKPTGGGTYVIQHLLTFGCLIGLMVLASQSGHLYSAFTEIPTNFFTWPVLLLAFIIIYETHGIFPFHSWVHDLVGKHAWYEISSIFLARGGVLLFVKFLLPNLNQDPDLFKILLLSLSILSSIYWSFRGIFEQNVNRVTTYFYVAQASLILTGLQADLAAQRGSYLHMMVISFSGTAMWSILSYIQYTFSFKRANRFYGLAQFYPTLGTLFCLFGFCMIGVPLLASFVVEDIVITGLLEKWPYLGLGHIIATCLNGILFFLIFSKLFMGLPSYRQTIKKMDPPLSHMVPYVFVLILMILVGVSPSLFLDTITW